jgi:hypothetical protein
VPTSHSPRGKRVSLHPQGETGVARHRQIRHRGRTKPDRHPGFTAPCSALSRRPTLTVPWITRGKRTCRARSQSPSGRRAAGKRSRCWREPGRTRVQTRMSCGERQSIAPAARTLDGPLGLVGAGYIGHLFAQQFALAGYEVRAWSPARSVHTLHDRLRQSVSTLAEIGAVEPSDVDDVLARVSTHDDLATALTPPLPRTRCTSHLAPRRRRGRHRSRRRGKLDVALQSSASASITASMSR